MTTELNERLERVRAVIPSILADAAGKSALYVGASPQRRQLADELSAAGWRLTLLEIYEPNADFYRERTEPFAEVITGDVRHMEFAERRFDLAVWWHGPEHASKPDGLRAIAALEALADTVVLASPVGDYPQDTEYGNRFERHRSTWVVEDYQALGYATDAIGVDGHCGSHVLAWKHTGEGE